MIKVYSDGSCKPTNPGPAGCGIVIIEDEKIIEQFSIYIGEATNNVAEISGVEYSLDYFIKNKQEWEDITIFTDSQYVIGLFSKNHIARKNEVLVAKVRKTLENFPNLKFEWVKGHNKDFHNELADKLAGEAVDSKKI